MRDRIIAEMQVLGYVLAPSSNVTSNCIHCALNTCRVPAAGPTCDLHPVKREVVKRLGVGGPGWCFIRGFAPHHHWVQGPPQEYPE